MSKSSISNWIHDVFQEVGAMILALVLASLPFAATAKVPTAAYPEASLSGTVDAS